MRAAAVLISSCAILTAPAAALAESPVGEGRPHVLAAQREATTGAGGMRKLPLPPDRPRGRARAAAALAGQGPTRVLVGVHRHADLPPVARRAARLGRVRRFDAVGVIGVEARSAAALRRALAGDPRVAYVEPDRRVRLAAEPFDAPDPETGVAFTWAYDAVRAAAAIAAAGGGSQRVVAIIDTGADVGHPDLAGRIAGALDTRGGNNVTDFVGHGTFVAGLISGIDGNGLGGRGVAGTTRILPIRASVDGTVTVSDLIAAVLLAVRARADVINMSLAGQGFTRSQARALDLALFNGVLPIAASGNNAQRGNPLEFPAAALGGVRGRFGVGLSVAAIDPAGRPAPFSNHNPFVSVSAPGSQANCRHGVFSTVPRNATPIWDRADSCPRVLSSGGGRFGYASGTSFAAPIAAGIGALAWQVEPRLQPEQVAHVLIRSARQTLGSARWNERTGSGIVDGAAATTLARTYDTVAPRARGSARRRGRRAAVRIGRTKDRTEPGHELAGKLTYAVLRSTNGGRRFSIVGRVRNRPFRTNVGLRGRRRNVIASSVCDGNGNCSRKRLRRFRP